MQGSWLLAQASALNAIWQGLVEGCAVSRYQGQLHHHTEPETCKPGNQDDTDMAQNSTSWASFLTEDFAVVKEPVFLQNSLVI